MRFLSCSLLAVLLMASARADDSHDAALPVARMETLVVHGEQPGPGLWRVSKDGHELWLLGTISPLPKRMQWNSREVEEVIASSQQVLMPPGVMFDSKRGFFGSLLLLPKLLKVRNNPEGVKLRDVVSPELYARWTTLKRQYIGRSRGVEKRRPILAAEKLQDAALDDHDLTLESPIDKVVHKAAKRAGATITTPSVKIEIDDPKALLKDLADTPLDDVPCFERILTRLEGDIETMKLRANAWALGEIEILQRLPYTDAGTSCMSALLQNRIAEQHGFSDLVPRVNAKWMEDAEVALAANTRSFAVLRMSALLGEDGYLARLGAKGYRIDPPGADDDAPHATQAAEPEPAE